MNWFCAVPDLSEPEIVATAGGVENYIEAMLEEGYELGDIYIFPMSARNQPKAITKPSFEFRP